MLYTEILDSIITKLEGTIPERNLYSDKVDEIIRCLGGSSETNFMSEKLIEVITLVGGSVPASRTLGDYLDAIIAAYGESSGSNLYEDKLLKILEVIEIPEGGEEEDA